MDKPNQPAEVHCMVRESRCCNLLPYLQGCEGDQLLWHSCALVQLVVTRLQVCQCHQARQLGGQVVQAVVGHIQVRERHHATNVTDRMGTGTQRTQGTGGVSVCVCDTKKHRGEQTGATCLHTCERPYAHRVEHSCCWCERLSGQQPTAPTHATYVGSCLSLMWLAFRRVSRLSAPRPAGSSLMSVLRLMSSSTRRVRYAKPAGRTVRKLWHTFRYCRRQQQQEQRAHADVSSCWGRQG